MTTLIWVPTIPIPCYPMDIVRSGGPPAAGLKPLQSDRTQEGCGYDENERRRQKELKLYMATHVLYV